jgi:putative ABC transport system permease protein
MWQDLRYAWRGLAKAPSFTAVAVLSLALGIGANSATFSVLYAVLLKPLPYPDAHRLVALHEFAYDTPSILEKVPFGNYVDWKARARSFEAIGYYVESYASGYNVTGMGEPEHLRLLPISPEFLALLGTPPTVGQEVARDARERGLLLSHDFWTRRFNGARDVVGRQLRLNEEPATIIGVLPEGFRFHDAAEILLQQSPTVELRFATQRTGGGLSPVGRLRPGVTLAHAQAEMDEIARQLAREHPQANGGRGIRVVSLNEHLAGAAAIPIRILYGAVCLVLLIACANVSALLLARLRARQREIGVRLALGANRGRLARQMLAESLLLALLGVVAGLLLASWFVDIILRVAPADLSRVQDVAVNAPVALFAIVVSALCVVLFGLAPVIQAGRVSSTSALGFARTTTAAPDRVRVSLIVGEMAIALVLLAGAGLLVQSYMRLTSIDLGFSAEGVVTMDVRAQGPRFESEWARVVAFHDRALEELAGVPGVRSVAVTSLLPLHERDGRFITSVSPGDGVKAEQATEYRFVSAGYFATLRVPLLRGRDFSAIDRAGAPRVAIIGESTARTLFGAADPIGREIVLRGRTRRVVVGVIRDIHLYGPGTRPPLQVYGPYPQADDIYWTGLRFVLRADGDPTTTVAAARERLLAIDRTVPPFNVQVLDHLVRSALAPARMYGSLFVAFAALALTLACVGLYGLISFVVTQRTREFGIRLALGADTTAVRGLVARETARLVVLALAIGGGLAFAGRSLIESLLVGVPSADWVTFVGVSGLLAAVAFVASYGPARRAMRVDPVVTLRTE